MTAAIVASLFSAVTSLAASVEQQDFRQLATKSELIFEGRVMSVEPRWNIGRTQINSWVLFEVTDVLKGQWAEPRINLRFAGGEVDGMRLEISGISYPEVGERGIYFVESTANDQFNPLLGWEQGRFRLLKDGSGHDRVCTAKGLPVAGLDTDAESVTSLVERNVALPSIRQLQGRGPLRRSDADRQLESGLSSGRALGVEIVASQSLTEAMTGNSFKSLVRALVPTAPAEKGERP